jgi:S-DNA-T family DNA segregation ATPase FtsK/SpoIIIE
MPVKTKDDKSKEAAARSKKAELALKKDIKRRRGWSVVLFALGAVLLIFAFLGDSAAAEPNATDYIHMFLGGMFGLSIFLTGPAVIYIAVMLALEHSRFAGKIIQLILLLLLISAAAQVFLVGNVESESVGDYIATVYNQGMKLSGGGVFGLILAAPLLMFGQVTAGILIVLILLVVVMLSANVTPVELIRLISRPFAALARRSKAKRIDMREERAYINEAREAKRQSEAEHQQRQPEQRRMTKTERERALEQEIDREIESRKNFNEIERVVSSARQSMAKSAPIAAENTPAGSAPPASHVVPLKAKYQSPDVFDQNNSNNSDSAVATLAPWESPAAPITTDIADESDLNPTETASETKIPIKNYSAPAPAAFAELVEQLQTAESPQSPQPLQSSQPSQSAQSLPSPSLSKYLEGQAEHENNALSSALEALREEDAERKRRNSANEQTLAELSAFIPPDGTAAGLTQAGNPLAKPNEPLFIVTEQPYTLPPTDLLNDIVIQRSPDDIEQELSANSFKLVETLKSFGVLTKIVGVVRGPSVTRYELQPAPGVQIAKITRLVDDIALNFAVAGVRIEAPIPGKSAVGIEVPNKTVDPVPFRALAESGAFSTTKSKLGAAIGVDITGETIIADIAKMPHILIAGTTGSGKSVCVNSIIMSILFRSTPDEVRLLMIDPKAVEFMIYNGIPHLLIPVVTDPKKAAGALGWAVTEMLARYKMFADNNVRDLHGYNALAAKNDEMEKLPQIVVFIDELADLMMASPGEVEDSICRLAQMARAAGMHLVIATQRPSVNVVTGVIKANIPSRIALKVASQVDSRTIIDSAGAEKLLGKGDMLYFPVGAPKPIRVQGCWVSEKEVDRVVHFIKNSFTLSYDESVLEEIERQAELAAQNAGKRSKDTDEGLDLSDDKLDEAIDAVIETGQASTSFLQRKLRLGYGRAARLIDIMEDMGVVGSFEGSKPRQVIMTRQEWLERKMNRN